MTTTTRTERRIPSELLAQLRATLAYARRHEYVGWDLYDGESSQFLQALPVNNKWLNLAFQQLPRRAPVNLRPLLLVEQRRNYLGAALFALANFAAHDLTGRELFNREAIRLVEWLVETRSRGYSGFCGGHNHPVQGLDRRSTPETPGVVGTSYAVKALLAADERTDGSYEETARTAARFVTEDLDYEECSEGARIDYRPNDPDDYYTLNANALGARLLIDLHDKTGRTAFERKARRILTYVASRQTDAGGWPYRDPPDSSHLSMDSFHNGFVLESLLRYRAVTDDDRFDRTIREGISFYRSLFDPDGAPQFDESNAYPRDVHAAAQGMIVFSRLEPGRAERVLRWTIEHLSNGTGRFYQEKRRLYTKRITLMRWCQAWMAYAIARHLQARTDEEGLSV